MKPIQGRPSGEIPVFSDDDPDVVDARNPDSVLFKLTDVGVTEASEPSTARAGGTGAGNAGAGNVGSGLIDVRNLVGDPEEVAVAPAGTLVAEVQSRASSSDMDEVARPSRWIWWVMGVLIVAVIGMTIKVLGLV